MASLSLGTVEEFTSKGQPVKSEFESPDFVIKICIKNIDFV